jgi:hypothetical protein
MNVTAVATVAARYPSRICYAPPKAATAGAGAIGRRSGCGVMWRAYVAVPWAPIWFLEDG